MSSYKGVFEKESFFKAWADSNRSASVALTYALQIPYDKGSAVEKAVHDTTDKSEKLRLAVKAMDAIVSNNLPKAIPYGLRTDTRAQKASGKASGARVAISEDILTSPEYLKAQSEAAKAAEAAKQAAEAAKRVAAELQAKKAARTAAMSLQEIEEFDKWRAAQKKKAAGKRA